MGSQIRAATAAGDDAPIVERQIDTSNEVGSDKSADHGIETLYRRHHARLLRFFRWRRHAVDAHDLVQETFVRYVDRSTTGPETVTEPDAYLSRVAANLLRDRAKFAVRRATAFHEVFDDEQTRGCDPIAALEARDLLRRLDVAVARLQPRRRKVFLLQRVDGLSYAEIAEITGMSIRTVKKQMAKALIDLRRDFGPI